MANILDTKIEDIYFGKYVTLRVYTMCRYHEIWDSKNSKSVPVPIITVRDLIASSEEELLREPNAGVQTINSVKKFLAKHGLQLRDHYATQPTPSRRHR